MKRLLFCLSDFRQGGIPRCLQSLLSALDPREYSVDVACLYQHGPYRGEMPNCRVLPADKIVERLMVHTKKITAKNFVANLPALATKVTRSLMHKTIKKDMLESRLLKMADRISRDNEYDAVIAYQEGFPALLARHIKAPLRMLWIHNDYRWLHLSDKDIELTGYAEFDKICCVSRSSMDSFNWRFPDIADKSDWIYNITNLSLIEDLASEKVEDDRIDKNAFSIVSIGRVCHVKHFDLIPYVARKLKDMGLDFKWYIIGSGAAVEYNLVVSAIKENGVEDIVTMLGSQDNPYKYMSLSDLYVLTSRSESYPTVINEAKALGLPIVSVDIPPAREMLDDDDVIVAEQDLADAIEPFIRRGRGNRRKTMIGQVANDKVLRKFSELLE